MGLLMETWKDLQAYQTQDCISFMYILIFSTSRISGNR